MKELNNTLPDEMVDPERLDELLVLIDRLASSWSTNWDSRPARLTGPKGRTGPGVLPKLFRAMTVAGGEREAEARTLRRNFRERTRSMVQLRQRPRRAPSATRPEPPPEHAEAAEEEESSEEDSAGFDDQIAFEPGQKRIDDPVRMYLVADGNDPLLTREEKSGSRRRSRQPA